MNIFMTNLDPKQCAYEHCTIHRNKMLTEYTQLLSTAHFIRGSHKRGMYKPYNPNGRYAQWAAASEENYLWLLEVVDTLHDLWADSHDNWHGSFHALRLLRGIPKDIPQKPLTVPPLADSATLDAKVAWSLLSPLQAQQVAMRGKFREWSERNIFPYFDLETPQWLKTE